MPGQPRVRAGARNSGIPRRLTLMNRQLAAGSAAIIQRDQELSRFRCTPLSPSPRAPATKKTPLLVQNLWTLCLPCGTPRKSKPKFRSMIDGNTKFKNSPAKLELSEISHNSWRPPMDRDPHQIRHPMHFSNSPLQFFSFLWYKQFTESRSVAAGRICVNLSRPSGI